MRSEPAPARPDSEPSPAADPGAGRAPRRAAQAGRGPFHERRFLLLALAGGLPAVATALVLLRTGTSLKVQLTLGALILACWLGFAVALRERAARTLQTLSGLLGALREGDYSIRARDARGRGPLGEVMREVNDLGETLREQRLGALEAEALARTVMEEINVAALAFDTRTRLRLVNKAGERLLAAPAGRLLGRTAGELGLDSLLTGEPVRTVQMSLPGGSGRYEARRSAIREHGLPLQLVVLADLSRVLREEERQAWQRLIRVLGHELNNSLTPIKSMAGSLEGLLARQPPPSDWREDMRGGLRVIGSRAESLNRFMAAYARLAGLPPPRPRPLPIGPLLTRVAGLETRVAVRVAPGPESTIQADPDQLEQLLINLVRNAADAALETRGGVRAGWSRTPRRLEIWVEDDGPGLPDTANLFVPFFTTKPGGSGIGLVLCRQIAEAHGGSLALENRRTGGGCRARLRLPI